MSHVLLSLATAVPVSAPKWQQDLWLLPLNCLLLHPPSPWLLKDVTTPAPFWNNMNSSACVTTTSLASPSTHHLNCHHQLFSPNKSSSDYHLTEHTLKALLKYYIQADPAPFSASSLCQHRATLFAHVFLLHLKCPSLLICHLWQSIHLSGPNSNIQSFLRTSSVFSNTSTAISNNYYGQLKMVLL